ncbi:MAG: hypothetical protein Q8N63_08040 [Nanoarchaeota archaeon]|nr:hypothetical protein [Nanoarchaeota archaeon]
MVKINLSIQKKDLWLLAAILMFVTAVGYVMAWNSGNPQLMGHNADNVFIYLNGNSKNLQTSINNGDFNSPFTGGGSYSGNIVYGHSGENIIVNVGGNVKSFQQAINDGSLCNAITGTSPANFGANIYGNTGDEIKVTIEGIDKSLQTAINTEDLSGCVFKYLKANQTRVVPEIISRSGADYEVQVIIVFNGTLIENFNASASITMLPGGAQSHQQLLYGSAAGTKIVGLWWKSNIISTIPTNGVVSANFTERMIAKKTYFVGNATFTINP